MNAFATPAEYKGTWLLKLYVAEQTSKSVLAFSNLKKICDQHLGGRYLIEIVDLTKQPHMAKADQIVAIPTVVRQLPSPARKIVGDLSNTEQVLVALGLPGSLSRNIG